MVGQLYKPGENYSQKLYEKDKNEFIDMAKTTSLDYAIFDFDGTLLAKSKKCKYTDDQLRYMHNTVQNRNKK